MRLYLMFVVALLYVDSDCLSKITFSLDRDNSSEFFGLVLLPLLPVRSLLKLFGSALAPLTLALERLKPPPLAGIY